MLQIKNTLGGGKPEGMYVWKKNEIGSELKEFNKSVSTLPYNFSYGSAVIYNNEIHILGGNYSSSTSLKHYKWNGSSWTSVSTLPFSFADGQAVVYNNEIHILGGSNAGTSHYKWDGSTWTSVSTLPYDFSRGSVVIYNNEIHILGGNIYNKNHYKWNGSSWTKVDTLPYEFNSGSAVVFNNAIHILGSSNSSYTKYHYKWDGNSWAEVGILPYNYSSGSAVIFDNAIHILGNSDTAYTKYHYKWDGSTWTSVSTLPYRLSYGSAVVYNNGIHILGSNESSYYKKHYLIIGYADVYTFLDYVVSDKETAYPDGGEKGGYWYEKVSEAKVATGTLTISDSSTYTLTIEHGLGRIPKEFYLLITSNNSVASRNVVSAYKNDTGCKVSYASVSYSDTAIESAYGQSSENPPEIVFDESNIEIPVGWSIANSSAASYRVCYFGSYRWVAIA